MPAELVKNEGVLEVSLANCRGMEFQDALARIKDIPGRRFDGDRKLWLLPADVQTATRAVNTLNPSLAQELSDWIAEARMQESVDLATPLPEDAELLIPWATQRMPWQPEYVNDEEFNGLFNWQRAAVGHMAKQRRVILADDLGLGKTIMMLSAVSEFLLQCWSGQSQLERSTAETRLLQTLQGAESGKDSRIESRRSGKAPGCDQGTNRCEEVQSMRGLLDHLASGVHGPGSRSGASAIQHRTVAGDSAPAGHDPEGNSSGGNGEVRGSMSELPPFATLARKPKLVVCPASVAGSWRREIKRWLGEDAAVAVGLAPAARQRVVQEAIAQGQWLVVNWEQLRVQKEVIKLKNGGRKRTTTMKEPLFETTDWLVVIADEAHHAKNRRALQTQGLWRCQGDLMIAATGTPIMNSPDELWAVLKWLFPKEYTSYWRFDADYVESYEIPGRRGRMVTGVRNPDRLRFELVNRLIRRTAEKLGLKGRKRFYFPVELNPGQRKLYDEASHKLWLEVKQENPQLAALFEKALKDNDDEAIAALYSIPNGGARTVRQRQIIETPANLGGKDDSAILDDCVEKIMDSRPNQWIVFCEFKGTCDALKARLEKQGLTVALYTGDVKPAQRTQIEDDYQARRIDVVVGTIKAMYQGITLTAGHNQYWCSRTWVPDVNEQGEARQDRLGQQKRVNVWVPQAENTVAVSKVERINRTKERIVRSVLPKVKIEEEHQ